MGWLTNPEDPDPGGVGLFETENSIRIFVDCSLGHQHRFNMEIFGNEGILKIIDGRFQFEYWKKDNTSNFNEMVKKHLPMNFNIGNCR